MRIHALILGVWVGGGTLAQAAERSVTLAGLDVTVWSQETAKSVPQPVIVFSHGFHGCATQSRFLMEAFASAGYLVLAPNHRDATCNGGESNWLERSKTPFVHPEAWDDTTYRDRAEDIRRLIDAIRDDEGLRSRADLSRLGLAGHSLGGYTVLGLGGAWPSWKLSGIKAVLALSPYSQPFARHQTLGTLSAPVMYQGGTLDVAITPALKRPDGAYDQSPQPKYFVEFDKAGHFAWTDVGLTAREEIVAYSVAFMDHYVKGEPADPVLTQALPEVARFRYASDVGNNGAGREGRGRPRPLRGP
jgi:predicted dienelactone hydrolase